MYYICTNETNEKAEGNLDIQSTTYGKAGHLCPESGKQALGLQANRRWDHLNV